MAVWSGLSDTSRSAIPSTGTASVLAFFGNRETVRIRLYYRGGARILGVEEVLSKSFHPLQNNKQEREKLYEKASLNCIGGKWIGFRSRAAF